MNIIPIKKWTRFILLNWYSDNTIPQIAWFNIWIDRLIANSISANLIFLCLFFENYFLNTVNLLLRLTQYT